MSILQTILVSTQQLCSTTPRVRPRNLGYGYIFSDENS